MTIKRLKYNRETNIIEVIEENEGKDTTKSKQDKIKDFFKGLPYIAIIGLLISLITLILQNKSLKLQNKQYINEIEKMNIELKEGYTQIKTSYICCDAYSTVIGKLYDDSFGIYPEVVFLSLESFGTRKLTNMKVIGKKVIYKEDIGVFAGEKILIPVFLRYDLFNDIKRKEEYVELVNEGDFIVSYFPNDSYTYKCIYVPVKVIYYDNITDENIEVEVRDMLDFEIKINEIMNGFG